ncbi:hypothetical protein BDA99DRAFT_519209 [Phascolomyces articulosus]|uniref:F-box domain-containing protein n=1 Tax=Phascolomyces articulosus TaxID=60185 RepID=A0AAD5JTP0_9FUNG|nr:hypothetical protein BDA99DRAFT_519209 [Phascolomyces articulosus]
MSLSSTSPPSLPSEILGVIAEALSFEDWFACILVNKEWSTEFTSVFYRSITLLTSRQCSLFHGTLLESPQLGYCIRKICIRAPDPPSMMLKHLPELCPFLTHLDLSKDIRGHIHDLPLLPLSFASLSSLTYLRVTSNLNDFSWLETLSQLNFLSIQWVGTKWSMALMTNIHTWCPMLNTLQLVIKSTNMATNPVPLFSSPLPRINKDIATNRQQLPDNDNASNGNSYNVSLTLKSANIYFPVELTHPLVAGWLNFCATKYPNLIQLTMGLEIGHQNHRSNPFNTNSNIKNHLVSSMELFSQSCPHIKSINLENFSEYYRLLQCINRHERQLEQLSIRDPYELVAWSLFSGTTESSRHSLSKLSIASFRDVLPHIEYGLVQHLQTLPNLSSLTLTECMNRISIDRLLYAAPQLKHLCLVATYLVTTSGIPLVEQHDGLEILEFKRNSVTQLVLKYINYHCHRLRQLIIERTSIPPLFGDVKQQSHISFANLNLEKVSLHSVSRKTVVPDSDSFVGVKVNTNDSFKWYHTGKDNDRNNKSGDVLGYKAIPYSDLPVRENNNALRLLVECRTLRHLYFNDTRLII